MRIIARRTPREFWVRCPESEQPLKAWFTEAQVAAWQNPQEVKLRYRQASFLADNRVVFNIGGNQYRLVTQLNYDFQIIHIKFIGTHAEYDRIDAETI